MKRLVIVLIWLLFLCSMGFSQKLRTIDNVAFTYGEKLKFKVHYGWINAGEITLEVKAEPLLYMKRPCYQIIGTGRSIGTFDIFFKIRDQFETHLDKTALLPWYFNRNIKEGNYSTIEVVRFNHFSNKISVKDGAEIASPLHIQDILSAFYYARSIDYSQSKPGDSFPLEVFMSGKVINMNYKFLGKETINTKFGKLVCLKFGPKLVKGRIFKKEEDMVMWVSDSPSHFPVRVEAKILVGSLRLDLEDYSGILYPAFIKSVK